LAAMGARMVLVARDNTRGDESLGQELSTRSIMATCRGLRR
jgi:hypothetical protein